MIVQETYKENLIRTYSDTGMQIRQVETDILYEEAVDILPCPYTYVETDIPKELLEEEDKQ